MKNPIVINQFKQCEADLYSPTFNFIGKVVGYDAFNDVRKQIKDKGLEGYHFKYGDNIIEVDSDGGIDLWYDGFFDQTEKDLKYLLGF